MFSRPLNPYILTRIVKGDLFRNRQPAPAHDRFASYQSSRSAEVQRLDPKAAATIALAATAVGLGIYYTYQHQQAPSNMMVTTPSIVNEDTAPQRPTRSNEADDLLKQGVVEIGELHGRIIGGAMMPGSTGMSGVMDNSGWIGNSTYSGDIGIARTNVRTEPDTTVGAAAGVGSRMIYPGTGAAVVSSRSVKEPAIP